MSFDNLELSVNFDKEKEQRYMGLGRMPLSPNCEYDFYNQLSRAADGRTLVIGPFGLPARQIREFAAQTSDLQIDALVARQQLTASTAAILKSVEFSVVIELLENGQVLPEAAIKRFVPGDLQRVVASFLGM